MSIKVLFSKVSNNDGGLCHSSHHGVLFDIQDVFEHDEISANKRIRLYCDAVIRNQIQSDLGVQAQDIKILRNAYGKPLLKDHFNYCFNVSHTSNAFVIAFSDEQIGVDIEQRGDVNIKIAQRFFTQPENEYILASNDISHSFFEIWTKKEAYIKYLGTGLVTPLNSFNVLDDDMRRIIHTLEYGQYTISICSGLLVDTTPQIIELNEEELINCIRRGGLFAKPMINPET